MGVLHDSNRLVKIWHIANYYFRYFGYFGHSPKYYLPIFDVNYFAKIFSLQNFVSYRNASPMNDQYKVLFEFYIKWYENGFSG